MINENGKIVKEESGLSIRILKQNTSNANGLRACLVNTI